MIYENIISSYENELEWVNKLRLEFSQDGEEENKMNYTIVERNDKSYIEYASLEAPIHNEQDTLDLIAACFENNTNLIMIHMDALADDFFKLRTGLAGNLLQKFMNYHIKAAVVITDDQKVKGKFKELLAESNKGNSFRVFDNREAAENWLLN